MKLKGPTMSLCPTVWVPVGRGGTRVLEVGRDGARDLGRDGNRVLGVGRDGARDLGRDRACVLGVGQDEARTQGVRRDRACGLGVTQDLLICLEPTEGVSVGAIFLALGIPNNDTRQVTKRSCIRSPISTRHGYGART